MGKDMKYKISLGLIVALIIVLLISSLTSTRGGDALYTVTADQWQEALGDRVHIQTIYRNVTVEMIAGESSEQNILATANGGLLLVNGESKLICVSSENGFCTYIYQNQKWDVHNRKDEIVDETLNTQLPSLVDMALAGLQGEFANAQYNAEEMCYVISHPVPSAEDGTMAHCKVYFENGRLVQLKTEIVSGNTALTLKLYNIGKTKVEAPAECQNN